MKIKTTLMVVSLVLSVVIGLVLARGGGGGVAGQAGPGAKGKVLIGLSLDTLKEARWQADRDLFVKRAGELGATVNVLSANSDDSAQVRDVQTLITSGVNVLVVVSHDGKAMAKAVQIAHDAGVPVLAYDRLILDSDLDLYMSFDNLNVGRLQAKYVLDQLNGRKANVVRIHGAPTDNNAKLFKQGADEVLKPAIDSGQIKVLHEDWAEDWRTENAKRIMNAAISAHPGVKIDAVIAANDGTAGGAIQALNEEGLAGKVIVTGQDAELVACQRIVQGTQSMTIYKPLHVLSTRAAEVAVDLARGKVLVANGVVNNGQKDVPSILNDVVAVTKENMMETVVKDGFHSQEAIYGKTGAQPAQ